MRFSSACGAARIIENVSGKQGKAPGMRVVRAARFGTPEVLETIEAPDPVAGPGQVVIGVSVTDVLFVDTQIRRGQHRDYFTVEPPYVPGAGVAGEWIPAGSAGASSRRRATATPNGLRPSQRI
jgi:hypothetical protein